MNPYCEVHNEQLGNDGLCLRCVAYNAGAARERGLMVADMRQCARVARLKASTDEEQTIAMALDLVADRYAHLRDRA